MKHCHALLPLQEMMTASGEINKNGIAGEGIASCANILAEESVNPSIKDALRALVTFLIIVFKVNFLETRLNNIIVKYLKDNYRWVFSKSNQ